jgi:polysaccharide deacetylase 2 family uncharacterized protein YibQ
MSNTQLNVEVWICHTPFSQREPGSQHRRHGHTYIIFNPMESLQVDMVELLTLLQGVSALLLMKQMIALLF